MTMRLALRGAPARSSRPTTSVPDTVSVSAPNAAANSIAARASPAAAGCSTCSAIQGPCNASANKRLASRTTASAPVPSPTSASTRSPAGHGPPIDFGSHVVGAHPHPPAGRFGAAPFPAGRQIALAEEAVHRPFRDVRAIDPCPAPAGRAIRRAADRSARSRRPVSSTLSGSVSRTRTPVMRAMASFWLSRCWTFSVAQTSMPASSSSSTSSQRLWCRLPGTLVCASSSISSSFGRRARAASRSNSSSSWSRYGSRAAAEPAGRRSAPRFPPGRGSRPRRSAHRRPPRACCRAAVSISQVLPTPGAAPRKTFRRPRPFAGGGDSRASGSGRRSRSSGGMPRFSFSSGGSVLERKIEFAAHSPVAPRRSRATAPPCAPSPGPVPWPPAARVPSRPAPPATRRLAGEMSGSSPEADVVTASAGSRAAAELRRIHRSRASISAVAVGARLEAPEALASYGVATVLVASFGSVPVGRRWARVELLWPGEILAKQGRADHLAVAHDQAAAAWYGQHDAEQPTAPPEAAWRPPAPG